MGFWESLGVSFIDDDSDLIEQLAGEEPTQEPEQKQPKSQSRSSSSLSSYTKEDLIIFMMVLFFGAALGYGYHKAVAKPSQTHQPICTMPHYPPSSPTFTDFKPAEQKKHKATEHHKPKPRKASLRYGYYEDNDGDLVLDEPTVMENWVIKTSFNGEIVDAFHVPDSDTVI